MINLSDLSFDDFASNLFEQFCRFLRINFDGV